MINYIQKKGCLIVDGRKIDYIEVGKGKPLILLPGLGGNYLMWKNLIPHLSRKYKVYSLTLPFYGTHNRLGHRYSFHTFPELIKKFIHIKNIKKPVIGGHSLGAIISVEYAALYPRSIRSLLLISAPLSDHSKPVPLIWKIGVDFALKSKRTSEIVDWLEKNQEVLKTLCDVLLPRSDSRRMYKAGHDLLKNIPIKAMASCYHDVFNWSFKNYLEKLKVPTLLVYGMDDQPINMFNGTTLYNVVPNAEIVALPGGHFLPSDNPLELSRVINEFLEKMNTQYGNR